MEYPPIVQVDSTGKVIGPIGWAEAHPEGINTPGILHATINCLVFRDANYREVLIAQRSKNVGLLVNGILLQEDILIG